MIVVIGQVNKALIIDVIRKLKAMMNNQNSNPSTGNGKVLMMQDLHKSYQLGRSRVKVLRGINFAIEKGEHVAIMGPSGSGKSTLLNILGCLDRPSEGRYVLAGQDIGTLSDDQISFIRGLYVGFVFQSFNLIDQLNVIDNIKVPMYYQRCPEREATQRAYKLASLVGLGTRIKHRPAELSGGERQRVAIARSLANDPLIILADEPTGNLDSEISNNILSILQELARQGKTLIVVTHDPAVGRQAERTIHLCDGQINTIIEN
jgi:putative ABC transport system ATP-binding protein